MLYFHTARGRIFKEFQEVEINLNIPRCQSYFGSGFVIMRDRKNETRSIRIHNTGYSIKLKQFVTNFKRKYRYRLFSQAEFDLNLHAKKMAPAETGATVLLQCMYMHLASCAPSSFILPYLTKNLAHKWNRGLIVNVRDGYKQFQSASIADIESVAALRTPKKVADLKKLDFRTFATLKKIRCLIRV